MIEVHATTKAVPCAVCTANSANVDIMLGDTVFNLCNDCATALLDNLKRKEAAENANTI